MQQILSVALTLTACCWNTAATFDLIGNLDRLPNVEKDNHFDFFVYSQLWPVSDCLAWKRFDGQVDKKEHSCNLTDFSFTSFTVHGLWPTRISDEGPQFCNHSLPFNTSALDPVLGRLEERWHEVRAGPDLYGFWKHEWVKHGTCAAQLPTLNSELKYFTKGLELQEQFNVHEMLKNSGIIPGGQYNPKVIVRKLGKELNRAWNTSVRPAISCVFLKKVVVLYEVRICLNKDLVLMDCGQSAGGIFGNCLGKETDAVLYPDQSSIGVTMWQLVAFICLIAAAGFMVLAGCAYHALTNHKPLDLGPFPQGWNKSKNYAKLYNEALGQERPSRPRVEVC